MRCLSAYVGLDEEFMSDERVSSVVDTANDRILGSPKRASIKAGTPVDGEKEKKLEEENGNSTKVPSPVEGLTNGDVISPTESVSPSSFMEEVPPTDLEKLEQVSDAIDSLTTGQGDGQGSVNREQPISGDETIAIFDPSHPPTSSEHPNSLPVDADAISLDSKPEADRKYSSSADLSSHPTKSRENLHLDLEKGLQQTQDGPQTPSSFVNSPIRVFRDAPIMRNPYVSPLHSNDELLKGLPPVHIIVSNEYPFICKLPVYMYVGDVHAS